MPKRTGDKASTEPHAAKANGPGRVAKRRRATRAKLLEAAYNIFAKVGVDDIKIMDVTDLADIGFGTFYNYFSSKDDLASQVLDCVIDDFGRRNDKATRNLRKSNPSLVMPISMRLVMREAAQTPMWQWWALRPDLLVDRMRDGFGRFAKRDIRHGIERGIFDLKLDEIDSAWEMAVWMMVGGVHDIVVGQRPLESEAFVTNSIMRVMGVNHELARQISSTELPTYSAPSIDWSFSLEE